LLEQAQTAVNFLNVMAREYLAEPDMTNDPLEKGVARPETSPNRQLFRSAGCTQCQSPSLESRGFALRTKVIIRRLF